MHLSVGVAGGVVLVIEVALEFDAPVEGKRRSADPLRPAPRIEPTVVEHLAPGVRIHPDWTDRKLLLDRKPAAEPPRVLAVDEPGIDAASIRDEDAARQGIAGRCLEHDAMLVGIAR